MSKLKRAEERFRLVVESAPHSILMVNDAGNITYANLQTENLFGYTRRELLGKQVDLLVPVPIRDKHVHFRETYFDKPEVRAMGVGRDLFGVRKDGSRVAVEIGLTPLDSDEGLTILATIVDITERKRAEETLQKKEEELRHSLKLEAVGRLAGGIAHDFNNMLTAIKGYSALVLEELKPHDAFYEEIVEIGKAADRSAELTQQLLAFSRKQVQQAKIIDLNRIIVNLERMLRRLIGEDIHLNTDLFSTLNTIKADSGQIEQVLVNLIVNARDAMPKGGKIQIKTENVSLNERHVEKLYPLEVGNYVRLSVCDTGNGIDKEVMSHIFEPFFTTKGVGQGSGLGLAMVYGIVTQSGGMIFVDSRPQQGAEFTIYLPAVDEEAETPKAAVTPIVRQAGKETILLVEDEESVRRLSALILKRSGYQVLVSKNCQEAIEIAKEHPGNIDLLLSDVVMPDINGPELADRILSIKPQMRVLFMSGYVGAAILNHGIENIHAPLLAKPFSPDSLLAKVREVLQSQAGSTQQNHN